MKKRKKMRKVSFKPDEYFQMGSIEMARFGNVISLRNNMTEAGHKELLNKLVQSHEQKRKEIDELIVEIRELVLNCYPLSLLCYAYQNFFLSMINSTSEVQLSHDDVLAGRELEYILSVIASTQIEKLSEHENDPTDAFLLISEKIHKLYSLVQQYFIYFIANERANAGIDEELAEFIFEAQVSRFYRGERYSVYEIDHLKEFCSPHNDVFMKLFNISINDFLDGLNKIRLSLTVGIREALSCLEKAMTEYERIISERREDDNSLSKILEENRDLKDYADKGMGMLFGNDLFNLSKLTSWPLDFLKKLSWTIGECDWFFGRPLYPGWPTVEMPISKKPFICINGQYYCFDYYNLFDNIYRTLEKLIMTEEPSYRAIWSEKQKTATENAVANLFQRLLPGCTILNSNYYPTDKSLKQCAENDIMVIYDDHLIIIEVKAGSYTYTAPMTDIESHVKSLQTLVGKADSQAERTLNYLKTNKCVKLYNEPQKNKPLEEKFELSIGDFNQVILFCVTLDNFNHFAAKAEKIGFLNLKNGDIVLSIDDLRVYADYFDSPCTFLHFLKQRKLATSVESIALNDELDHLGMYIKHNMYSITASEINGDKINWLGYREDLDTYFSGLSTGETMPPKPVQEIPERLKEIITLLDSSHICKKSLLASFLLDFSQEARDELDSYIESCLSRQKQRNKMSIISTFGNVRYSMFCHQVDVDSFSEEYSRNYTLSTMVYCKEESRLEFHLYYDKDDKLIDINFQFLNQTDIPSDRIGELRNLGSQYAESRIKSYIKQNGNEKIGRNEVCPCGSGLKYKKCHGR